MKTNILKYSLSLLVLLFIAAGCTKDFEELNTDPNRPKKVPTTNLITTAQRVMTDDIFDEWFSGRQGLLWSQYWSQRNYTSEDRFAIRQGTNNTYFRLLYLNMMDLEEIKKIASDPANKAEIESNYGDPQGQVAVANIIEAYVFQLLASTYGDIPYEEAFDALNKPTPAYSTQKVIFLDLFKRLKEAADYLATVPSSKMVFTYGDIMYNGSAAKWAKFANSLRLKLAIRLSKVTDAELVAARTTAITEASTKAFTSNADNAQIVYLGDGQSDAPIYAGSYGAGRNDMTVTAQFVNLMKGIDDPFNATKVNPFKSIGEADPRLAIWVPKTASGDRRGMPYGLSDKEVGALWSKGLISNIRSRTSPVFKADATVAWMDYAEVCFILSELKNWDETLYKAGVAASMERWEVDPAAITAYVAKLPAANQETVLTQKYIALYMNGYEAWAEWRRTGFPKSIIQVGELTGPTETGVSVPFTAIVGNAIPRRLTYPVQEYTVNNASVTAAATAVGGDNFNTRLIWDKP